MGFLVIEFIISFFVLVAINAPWWSWLVYAISVFLWLIISALKDCDENAPNTQKQEQL